MSRPTCPTRSFETQQLYRVERRSVGGERKVEVVRERMYVGGLNPEVTGELLVEVFSQFGLVKHAIVIAGKNYGFVTFASPASVEQLLEMREPLEVAGSKVILRQARRQLWKEEDWSSAGGMSRRRSSDSRWREQAWWGDESEGFGPVKYRNQLFDNCSAATWVEGDMPTVEPWEAEWMPLPSPSPQTQYLDFYSTQPEEMVMMVSLKPHFLGQQPLLAPDGQLVYPVDSFPARLGTPGSCSYLGSIDLPIGGVGGGTAEDEENQRWSGAHQNLNNLTLEAGSRLKGQEAWSRKERRGGDGKEKDIPRREPRTFGKWMAASKREKKVLKKKNSGKSSAISREGVKKPKSSKTFEVQMGARDEDDVQIEDIGALQKEKRGEDTPKNGCGEKENMELLADSLKPLKLDWNELE